MQQPMFKIVIEDSYRNKYFLYYSGTSVCCKEISKDGITRDTIIASQVSENFLATIDLQDRVYVACYNKEKGIYLLRYSNGDWKLEHIINIQASGNIKMLSLFGINGSLHIIYARQMTIANFYNVIHLYKPNSPNTHDVNTTWRKNNICEMYAENFSNSYAAVMSKEGAIHLTCEWFDGNNYLINYYWFDSADDGWKNKTITSLFKKDISLSILYEDSFLHLLCYTYEDDASAIFCYVKKEGSGKDFEFSCLDKINAPERVSPSFYIEGSITYASWIYENKFYQYTLNHEQKNWIKKIISNILVNEPIQRVEYLRNRKGRYWIIKNTYFTIDHKYNINLPYFRDNSYDEPNRKENVENTAIRNYDGDLINYVPLLIDEVKSLSDMVKSLTEELEEVKKKKTPNHETNSNDFIKKAASEPKTVPSEPPKLKRSNFREQFMKSNKLLNRPEATALFVGSSNIPNPDELSKKKEIEIVENQPPAQQVQQAPPNPIPEAKTAPVAPAVSEAPAVPEALEVPTAPTVPEALEVPTAPTVPEALEVPTAPTAAKEAIDGKVDNDTTVTKEGSLFKKLGDLLK